MLGDSILSETRKKYLAKIFLNKSNYKEHILAALDFSFDLLRQEYTELSDKDFNILKNKYQQTECLSRVALFLARQFTEEELQKLIGFYSSSLGKKISNPEFTISIDRILKDMNSRIEIEMKEKNEKSPKTS